MESVPSSSSIGSGSTDSLELKDPDPPSASSTTTLSSADMLLLSDDKQQQGKGSTVPATQKR